MTEEMTSLHSLVDDLSSPESSIRDDRALAGLAQAILSDEPITDEETRELFLYAVRPAGPLATIGDPEGSVSAFGRSFNLELLAIICHRDNTHDLLSAEERTDVLSIIERVARDEQDFRGYTGAQGWVHVVAHVADLADEYLASPRITTSDVERAISAILSLADRSPRTYVDGEEDRIAIVLCGAHERGQLDTATLEQQVMAHVQDHPSTPARRNWIAILRSMSFRFNDESQGIDTAWIRGLEAKITGL